MKAHILKNRSGFTLLEFMVGVGIITIASVGVISLSVYANKTSAAVTQRAEVLNLKSIVMSHIENPESWQATVKNSGDKSMDCLKDGSNCNPKGHSAGSTIDIYNSDGTLFYASTKASAGFQEDGTVCNDFSSSSSSCPYRYEISWKPICPNAGTCTNPLISISGSLKTSDKIGAATIADAGFAMLRSFSKNTIGRNCKALNGTMDHDICVIKNPEFRCPAGKMVTGLGVDLNPICGAPAAGQCPANQFLVSFDVSTGQPVCRTLQKQFSILSPETSGKIACFLLGKGEGDSWYSLFGQNLVPEACPDNQKGNLIRAYTVEAEITCKSGYAVPTGRTKETKTDKVIGSCEPEVPPAGVASGDYFWVSAGQTKEAFGCYGSPDPALTRYITFNVEREMLNYLGSVTATGRTRKTEVNRDPCPSVSGNQNFLANVNAKVKPASTKILFVIDNSNSMSAYQATLSSKVGPLISALKGTDVSVKIINSTGVGLNTSPLEAVNTYTDMTGNTFDYTKLSSTATDLMKSTVYRLKALPTYTLAANANATQIDNFQKAVTAGITAQGISGSDIETSMCNLLTSLYDEGPNKFFEKGDLGGIIVLTDDDDYSTWKSTSSGSCKNFLNQKVSVSGLVSYNMSYYRWQLGYQGYSIKDGLQVNGVYSQYMDVSPTDSVVANTVCPADVEAGLTTLALKAGNAILPFQKSYCKAITSGGPTLTFDYSTVGDDYCKTQFVKSGITYLNIPDYYKKVYPSYNVKTGSCSRATRQSESAYSSKYTFGFSQFSPSTAIYSKTLPQAVYDRGRELFGDRGFFLLNIVMTDPNLCSPVSSQPKSSQYLNIAGLMSVGKNSYQNFSICGSNDGYGATMTNLAESIKVSIDNSVTVDLAPGAVITSVSIVSADKKTKTLKEGVDYQLVANRIDFTGYSPQQGDTVQVTTLVTYHE